MEQEREISSCYTKLFYWWVILSTIFTDKMDFCFFPFAHVCNHHPLCARLRRMLLSQLFDVYHFVCVTRRFIRLSVSSLELIVFAKKKKKNDHEIRWLQINLKLLFPVDRDAIRANKIGEICLANYETFQFQIDRISYCSIFPLHPSKIDLDAVRQEKCNNI